MTITRFSTTEPETLQNMISGYITQHPDAIRQTVEEEFSNSHGAQVDNRVVTAGTDYILQNASTLVRLQSSALESTFGQLLSLVQNRLPSTVYSAHIRALSESLVPVERLRIYRALKWSLVVQAPDSFVLGDIGPIALGGETLETVAPLVLGDDLRLVLLPISDRHMLVGATTEHTEIPDADAVNTAIAELSREFFVSKQRSQRESGYADRLGVRAFLLSTEQLSDIENDFVSSSEQKNDGTREQRENHIYVEEKGMNPFMGDMQPKYRYQQRKPRKVGRNEKCPCGSGLKYKKCCLIRSNYLLRH